LQKKEYSLRREIILDKTKKFLRIELTNMFMGLIPIQITNQGHVNSILDNNDTNTDLSQTIPSKDSDLLK